MRFDHRWRRIIPRPSAYIGYLAELIDEWAPEGDPNERLFRLGTSVVDALAGDVPVQALVRYFEYLVAPAAGRVSFCVRLSVLPWGSDRRRASGAGHPRFRLSPVCAGSRGGCGVAGGARVPEVGREVCSQRPGVGHAGAGRLAGAGGRAPGADHVASRKGAPVHTRAAGNDIAVTSDQRPTPTTND